MRYIRLKNQTEKSLSKLLFSTPGKIFAGLAIFLLILLFFIFAGTKNFFFTKSGINQFAGRTNILILGTGGEGHAGINLSDTIILASVNHEKKDVALVSIPRDLWVEDSGAKINMAYATGEEKKKGEGLNFAKDVVGKITGVPINYVIRVDFAGFARAIDLLGGIDVEVEKGFDDFKYPIDGKEDDTCGLNISEVEVDGVKKLQVFDATGAAVLSPDPFTCRYQHVQFRPGLQHMDGAKALKFVRSRMGTNGAGSDFARSTRQRQVILAATRKVFDLRNLFSPKKITEILTTFDKSLDTDFGEREFSQVPTFLSQINEFNFRNLTLSSEGVGSLLYNPPVSQFGAWVLLPKDNNWENLTKTIKDFIYQEVKTF